MNTKIRVQTAGGAISYVRAKNITDIIVRPNKATGTILQVHQKVNLDVTAEEAERVADIWMELDE